MDPPIVVVLACDRRQCSYVENTTRQIDQQGGGALPRMVMVDGDGEFAAQVETRIKESGCSGWEVIALGSRRGSTLGMWGALKAAAPRGRDVLFFEDDVELCRNAVERMVEVTVPEEYGLVTFFDMKEVPGGSEPGMYARPKRGELGWQLWGCQAMRIPAEMVQWLADCNWLGTRIGPGIMASDLILGVLLDWHIKRRRIAVHIPCLVQHVGAVSGCAPGTVLTPQRGATNYPGRQFDATSLPTYDGFIEELQVAIARKSPPLPAWRTHRYNAP